MDLRSGGVRWVCFSFSPAFVARFAPQPPREALPSALGEAESPSPTPSQATLCPYTTSSFSVRAVTQQELCGCRECGG